MGEVEGGMIDGVSASGLGLDLTEWVARTWQPGPLTSAGLTPSPLVTTGVPAMTEGGIPSLLARPAETGESPPWLLFAGLGLVAYMMFK
jgi:hypothetical protein